MPKRVIIKPCDVTATFCRRYRDEDQWRVVSEMPFLDAAATPRLWRSFYVPYFGPKNSGMNCIKIGLPGKLILSKRKCLPEVLFS